MPNEVAKTDGNSAKTMIAIDPSGEIKNVAVNASGNLITSVAGGATEAKQDSIITALTAGDAMPAIDDMFNAVIAVAAATADSVLVAAPGALKQIWVYSIMLTVAAAGTVLFESGTASARSGVIPLGVAGGFSQSSSDKQIPIMRCATNESLTLTTVGAGANAAGFLSYAIVSV